MSLYSETKIIVDGIEATEDGVTGSYFPVGSARRMLVTLKHEGVSEGSVYLQYESPFSSDGEGVIFHVFSGLAGDAYAESVFVESPLTPVRAIVSGDGSYWVALNLRN